MSGRRGKDHFEVSRAALRTGLVSLTALVMMCSCTKEKEATESAPEPGTVALQTTPFKRSTTPPICRIDELSVRSLGGQPVLLEGQAQAAIERLAPLHFDDPAGSARGLRLQVEHATTVSAEDGKGSNAYFGAQGFIEQPERAPPLVLRTEVTRDGLVPDACKETLAEPECRRRLLEDVAVPAFDQLLGQLAFLCRLEACNMAYLKKALSAPTAWQKSAAAQAVGECGAKELAEDLVKLARADDAQVAVPAIGALGRLAYGPAVAGMIARAHRAEGSVVHAVAVALADIDSPESLRYLRNWASYHSDPSVKELAGKLLESRQPQQQEETQK